MLTVLFASRQLKQTKPAQEVAEKAGDTRAALGVIATELEAAYHRIKNDLRTE